MTDSTWEELEPKVKEMIVEQEKLMSQYEKKKKLNKRIYELELTRLKRQRMMHLLNLPILAVFSLVMLMLGNTFLYSLFVVVGTMIALMALHHLMFSKIDKELKELESEALE